MESEPHPSLEARWQRHGAGSVRASRAVAICTVASRLRSSSSTVLSGTATSAAVGVASFGAGHRLSFHRRVEVASSLAVQRRGAVLSGNSWRPAGHPCLIARLPNQSLEPTPVTNAPLLRVGSGAAQLNRWAAK